MDENHPEESQEDSACRSFLVPSKPPQERAEEREVGWNRGMWLGVEPRTGDDNLECERCSESSCRACAARRVTNDEKLNGRRRDPTCQAT